MSIDTAIETMIQNHIDEQDYVSRTDASVEAESYTDQCIGDIQDEIGVLMVRLEELESRTTSIELVKDGEPLMDPEAPAAVEQEPRAVNQIDWIMTPSDFIAGYDSKAMLESYVRSCLHQDQTNQTEMVIAMVLATARNLINNKLESGL